MFFDPVQLFSELNTEGAALPLVLFDTADAEDAMGEDDLVGTHSKKYTNSKNDFYQ